MEVIAMKRREPVQHRHRPMEPAGSGLARVDRSRAFRLGDLAPRDGFEPPTH